MLLLLSAAAGRAYAAGVRPGAAVTIVMQSGQRTEGVLLSETADSYIIEKYGLSLTLRKSDIQTIAGDAAGTASQASAGAVDTAYEPPALPAKQGTAQASTSGVPEPVAQARQLFATGDYRAAAAACTRAISDAGAVTDALSSELYFLRGLSYRQLDLRDKMISDWKMAAALQHPLAYGPIDLAGKRHGRWTCYRLDGAVVWEKKFIHGRQVDTTAPTALAPAATSAAASSKPACRVIIDGARELIARGDFQEALEMLVRADGTCAEQANVFYQRHLAYLFLDKKFEALQAITTCVAMPSDQAPNPLKRIRARARVLHLVGNYQEASTLFTTVYDMLQRSSPPPDALGGVLAERALAYLQWRRYDEAIRDLDKALSLAPGERVRAQAHFYRALAYMSLNDSGRMRADFKAAKKLNHSLGLGPYIGGRKHGPFVWYAENGEIEKTGFYFNNKRQGLFTWLYPDGGRKRTGEFRDGKKEGRHVWYYESGAVQKTGNFVDGRENGTFIEYDQNGTITAQHDYRNGVLISASKF